MCDTTCADCSGPGADECTRCDSARVLLGTECKPCDDIPGLRAPPNGLNDCLELCGDSKNLGINECDDGNTIDGDGCSGNCVIEAGYVCLNGTPTTPDTCVDIVPPYPTSVEIDSAFNVNITFTENVQFSKQPGVADIEL